jgi:hypothetical protein
MRSRKKINFSASSNSVCLIGLLAAGLAVGCHKAETAVQASPPQADATTTAPADAASSAATPANAPLVPGIAARTDNAVHDSVNGEVNAFLTRQLRVFVQQKGRLPSSFNEFARTRLDSIPRPPAGKKWAIDATTGEVKAMDAQ